jgi:Domain of unknown function (DUF4331)
MRRQSKVALVAAGVLLAALGTAPVLAGAADHLDAPGLTSPSAMPAADITDIYTFAGSRSGDDRSTVLVLNTHPGLGALSPLDYATDVTYRLNIDRDGDAVQDLAYVLRFGKGNGTGKGQPYTITRYTRANAQTLARGEVIAQGRTGRAIEFGDDAKAFVGPRSDPFFFDLNAFLGAVVGNGNGRTFCDQPGAVKGVDFFAPLNVNSIVLQVPTQWLGSKFSFWATTFRGSTPIDRMGRPAINTVFNKGADKNAFNAGTPATDFAGFSGNVVHVLEALGKYDEPTATAIAHVLLPDVLTYDTTKPVAGPLNGRGLTDDVIDVELGLVTHGGITTDCVGKHTDISTSFPYLGAPHQS